MRDLGTRELTAVTEQPGLGDDAGQGAMVLVVSTDNEPDEHPILLGSSYAWFNGHLPVPPFDDSRWPRDVVAWFKDYAGEPVRRTWEIVSLLRDHDVLVRLLKSADPGRVLYEDPIPGRRGRVESALSARLSKCRL